MERDGMAVSAQRLIDGLVRKAPVAIRWADDRTGYGIFEVHLLVSPYVFG